MLQQQDDEVGLTEALQNRFKGDAALAVVFKIEPMQNKAKSLTEGRPIFEDTEFISIRVPGDREGEIYRKVRPTDLQRFPEHYRLFKARQSQELVSGTPLGEWSGVSRSQVEELKFYKIHTVEQLSTVADVNCQNFRGMMTLREKAQKYLEVSNVNAKAEDLLIELNKRDDQIALLTERLNALENAPKELTQGQKAAATRARNKAAKQEKLESEALDAQEE